MWREQAFGENDLRCIETYVHDSFDADLREYGMQRPVMLEHAFFARKRPIEAVPIGRTITLTAHQFGLWAIAELNPGPLPDAVLESARSGALGWSIRARDVDPQPFGATRKGLPEIIRRTMTLRELSVTSDPAYSPETLLVAVSGQAVQRENAALPIDEFFQLCDRLAADRGENNKERIDNILAKDSARRERGKQRWLDEIATAHRKMAQAAAWRRQSSQIQQAARNQGQRLSQANLREQLDLCTRAATAEAEARPVLASFNINPAPQAHNPDRPRSHNEIEWVSPHTRSTWEKEQTQLGMRTHGRA